MAVAHRGAISFGMVHIPVGLYTATQDNDIHFNQLCKEDGSRVKYKKVCSGCGKEIGAGDIVSAVSLINAFCLSLILRIRSQTGIKTAILYGSSPDWSAL